MNHGSQRFPEIAASNLNEVAGGLQVTQLSQLHELARRDDHDADLGSLTAVRSEVGTAAAGAPRVDFVSVDDRSGSHGAQATEPSPAISVSTATSGGNGAFRWGTGNFGSPAIGHGTSSFGPPGAGFAQGTTPFGSPAVGASSFGPPAVGFGHGTFGPPAVGYGYGTTPFGPPSAAFYGTPASFVPPGVGFATGDEPRPALQIATGVEPAIPPTFATTTTAVPTTPVMPATRTEVGLAADVWLGVDWGLPPAQTSGGEDGGFFGGFFDDPLLLDLDRNGVNLTSVQDGVMFDINGDGRQERVAWTQAGDAAEAWLVRDDARDGGQAGIQSGLELFGDQHGDANGFARLANFDDNHDGVFDARDAAFDEMQLWQDKNHNGISEAGELVSLADKGITSIAVAPTEPEGTLGDGTRVLRGSFTREVPV